MSDLHLIIGNKNYSSWSLRPWLAMSVLDIPFRETVIPLDMPDTAARIREHSGAGKVPILRDGDFTVWESLAILEYLAERFPEAGLWPAEAQARAIARAISGEMHAGFTALRNACPMNLRRPRKAIALDDAVQKDVARILEIWRLCRKHFGEGGHFLFGRFTAADAMFAPVASRLATYAIAVDDTARAYIEAVMALPAFQAWKEAGVAEPWRIEADEVD